MITRQSTGGLVHVCKACRANRSYRQFSTRPGHFSRKSVTTSFASIFALGGAVAIAYSTTSELHADAPVAAEIEIEKPKKKKGQSKEQTRDAISSQHLQVKRSWENPGVYTWGSNVGRVAAPDSDETYVKNPRRIRFFDGQVLRDLKLDNTFGAAISEKGDLYQWGTGYAADTREPVRTLKGKDLKSLAISKDRILALSSSGKVYSVPVSKEDQLAGSKPSEGSWIPFWPSTSKISYRTVEPKLGWSEKVESIAAGLEHVIMQTTAGRVFSAAASSSAFPTRGQLGIPGLFWATRPEGAYDQPHELTTLRGFTIKKIAAGDLHSLVLDSEGRVFAFGDNSAGQLGQEPNPEIPFVDSPSLLPISRLYAGSGQLPVVTGAFAGGLNSFFTVEATQLAQPGEENRLVGRISADTWACGQGIAGQLGTGKWTHVQGTPAKIKALSGLFEYDETSNKVIPIRLASLNVGSNSSSAVMKNVTYTGAHAKSSEHDTNWGADVLWWGGNEYYQLGTGKRSNISNPVYIGPLDGGENGEKRDAHRFQITPRTTVNVNGRKVSVEQRIECGRFVSGVYSGT
jgi:alpha-tubulin suppressor-like RCC1 family protein